METPTLNASMIVRALPCYTGAMWKRPDPFDDGGTPMWRARQSAIIDTSPPITRPVAYARAWFRRTPLPRIIGLILALFLVLPFAILFGGIAFMAIVGINPG